ncbi:tautomerase family protein [Chromohalobacter canadensis]|uniref:Tautomerase family protein n=1 Tax=Chromohalobacter canadensis TaxID=141389 RepID=A0ABZ0Y8S4_9GAMM|nr:tautomerase family protein [Chromohalobacter canadensis]MCK0769810.1 tautomerase family protein [Chromohalobacter canadensis]WQH08118.1 tautomerase family protein [Chromohalobacter canadensis]
MPLVTISVPDHRPALWRKQVADIVNAAVIETLDFPPDDRYQLIQTLPAEQIELQDRNRDAIVLQLTMRAGRPSHAKQAFYQRIVDDLASQADLDPANVMIVITENADADWSFGHGEAQFLVAQQSVN